jgi:gliding motility-associated-like protein
LAGDTLAFAVVATDPDLDNVRLEAFSSIFSMPSPAYFPTVNGIVPVTATFFWATNCGHVRRNAYSVLFKATDNGSPVNLTAFKTVNITVVAPKPENLTATAIGNQIQLHWLPSICTNVVGYKVFKRVGSYPFTPAHCETGLPASAGYTLIGTTANTAFIDDGSVMPIYHGNEYCYRVYAIFADGAESYVSDEVCVMLIQDAPLITHVDVNVTALDTGKIIVKWVKPYEMDTNRYAPPYWYKLYRHSSANTAWTQIAVLGSWDDSLFIDNQLNTKELAYTYKIELYAGLTPVEQLVETSDPATSLFLTITPKSRALRLSWIEQTPWQNLRYIIYRYNEQTAQFDSIGHTTHCYYQDNGLQNGHSYCYYVKSEGGYFVPDTLFPNYNRSQQTCQIPIDREPPDAPILHLTTDCKTLQFYWSFDNDTTTWDIAACYIYYKPYYKANFSKIDSFIPAQCVLSNDTWHYEFRGLSLIAGCFALAAIDTNGNLSALSNDTCFDPLDCLNYRFPNIFTPNNDGYNDLFTPYPYTNISKVKFVAYNRWGGMVDKTENPDINWDGVHILTKQPVPDGTYYFTCDVYITTLEGKEQIIPLNGTVLLVRETK